MARLDLAWQVTTWKMEGKLHLKDHDFNECMVHSNYPVAMQNVQNAKNCKLLNKQNIEFQNSVQSL